MLATYADKYPVGRVGEVSDTSAAISFLADNNVASFLTGILLPVDGGSIIAGAWILIELEMLNWFSNIK